MNQPAATFQHYTAPPTFRVALAERPSLFAALQARADCRVILVDAPAGYGKTWLLGRWHAETRARGASVAWVGVEQADASQFLALIVAALARAGVNVGRLEAQMEQGFGDVPVAATVGALTAALAAIAGPLVVFVDDLHRLSRDAVQEVLNRLVVEAAPHVRFVLSGRDSGALPRAALRTRGELLELGTEHLRFRADEARDLLPTLSSTQLEQLLERTEGWPVALQLARLWVEARPERSQLLESFSGRTTEVAEYLTEQVLADLPTDLQQVLSEIAILDSLNPQLVTAVTNNASAWRRLLDDGLLEHFLVPLDQERYWFRLHHLLRDFLRARHRERGDDLRELHARAAGWFERDGELQQAVRHSVLAQDVPRAASLVERTGGWQMVLFGGTVRMRALLSVLPAGQLAEFPRVQLYQAFLAAKDGDLARGVRMYESVAARHSGTSDPALSRDLLVIRNLLGRYADWRVGPGDLEELYRGIDALPVADDVTRATLLTTACLVALAIGDMAVTLEACHRAVRQMRRIGSVIGVNYCLLHLGLALLHSGERREAEATLQEAAAMAEENFGVDSGLKAIADVYLALALHARGDVAGAAARLDVSLKQVETADSWLDLYAEGYEVAIANALARGDPRQAAEFVDRMLRTARSRELSRLEELARAFRARLDQHASSALAPLDEPPAWPTGRWRELPSAWREHHAAGLARILRALRLQHASQALEVIDDLEAAASFGHRQRHLWILSTVRAAALLQQGSGDEAIAEFVRAIEPAVREDDTRFLVDLGPALLPMLQRAWAWSRENGASSRLRHVLADAVTTLARASDDHGTASVLSARELEVLVELARGAPNKVIARNLHMTENTVKFHLKNVFQKLQVRYRAEALQAARTRGLLP
jgi:LuxR family maltose regulon positive regulatory protein